MKKKVYLWLLAMCVTAGTATPVYAVEPMAEQSTVEEKTGNVEENQEQEKAPENNGENFGKENPGEVKAPENSGVNSGEVKAPENSSVNSGEVKAPENSGVNSGGEKEPEDGGVNSGEGKDTENSGENADEEEKSGEVAEVPEDELALQELGEENQIAAFAASQTVTTFDGLKTALEDETCSEIQVSGTISVTETLIVNREVKLSGVGTLVRGVKSICLIAVGEKGVLTLENIVLDGKRDTYRWDDSLLQVENGGSLTLLEGAVFQDNHTNSDGSAIQIFDGSLLMEGGTIRNNETSQEGGGIYIYKGSFVLKNGTICNNIADRNGGGIYVGSAATFRMEGGEISGNTGYSGGMLLDCPQTAEITGGTIKGNTATGTGGGIFARCQVHIKAAAITGNTATHGGGISVLTTNGKAAGVVMDGGSITGNAAKQMERGSWGDGGGVYLDGAELTLNKGAIISDNTAERDGGGIYSDGTITMNDGKITNNTGVYGGGIYNEWSSNASIVTINGGEISGNTSKEGSGGGIVNHKTLIMTGGSVTGNKAKKEGGGIYQYRDFQVSGTVRITGNTESGGKTSNVFLDYKTYNETEPNRYVTIISPGLSSGSQIGVNINPGKDLNITQAINDKDYSKYFTSDDSNYEIMNVESNGKHQVSLKKKGSGNTGGSESGGSTGGNTGGSESGGSTGGNTGGSESGGTTGGNNGGNTSGSTTGTSTGTSSSGSSAGTAASTPATTTPKETTITVPLQADTQESTLETGNLPTNLQQRVLNQKISHTVLSSTETGVKVGLDIEAVRSISGQAQGDASVVVQKLDNTALKGSAAAVIGTRPVVTVRVQDAAGKAITDLGAGSALVEIPYVLQNGENPGNICAVSTDAEGNVQWILNSVYDSEKQVLRFSTLQGADYGVASIPVGIYQDTVGTDKQADIAFAVSRGLLTGDAKGQDFNPEKAVTMEEFANALDRMTGKKVSDVVLGSFAPDQSITREEMAVLLVKYADTLGIILPKVQTANAFADQNRIQTEALSAVQLLQQAEVLEAKENQNFAPKEEVTRAECCTTLRLFMEMMVKGTCRTN